MKQRLNTYRLYKKLSNPVLGRRKLNQAGFFKFRTIEEGSFELLLLTNCGGHTLTSKKSKFRSTLFDDLVKLYKRDSRSISQSNNLVAKRTAHTQGRGMHLLCVPFIFLRHFLGVLRHDSEMLYKAVRMGNKQSCTLLRKPDRGLYYTV